MTIVYESNTGHTKQYAKMLSEKLNIPYFTISEARANLKKHDEIVFLGWVCATKIRGLGKIVSENKQYGNNFTKQVSTELKLTFPNMKET